MPLPLPIHHIGFSVPNFRTAIDACVSAIQAQSCSTAAGTPSACSGVVRMTATGITVVEGAFVGAMGPAAQMSEARALGVEFAATE